MTRQVGTCARNSVWQKTTHKCGKKPRISVAKNHTTSVAKNHTTSVAKKPHSKCSKKPHYTWRTNQQHEDKTNNQQKQTNNSTNRPLPKTLYAQTQVNQLTNRHEQYNKLNTNHLTLLDVTSWRAHHQSLVSPCRRSTVQDNVSNNCDTCNQQQGAELLEDNVAS